MQYKPYKILDFSGGMNTTSSAFQIGLNECVLMRNMTTNKNKIITLPGFERLTGDKTPGGVQGGASSGKRHAWIVKNTLYYYDDETKADAQLPNAVGIGTSGTIAKDEDYTILFYKNFIIITNSLKTGRSTLQCEGEVARVFKINQDTYCSENCNNTAQAILVPHPVIGYPLKYAPTASLVFNGRLYLGGGPRGAEYVNYVYWGGRELPDNANAGVTTSVSYLFNFFKSLTPPSPGIPANYSPGFQELGDGEPITAFFANGNKFLVGTRSSIYETNIELYKTGNVYESTYLKTPVKTSNTGIKSQSVIKNMHNNTIYFDGTHIRRLEYDTSNQTLRDVFLSDKIQSYLDNLPRDQSNATSSYSYPYFKLFLKSDYSAKSNDIAVVYNVIDNSWSVQDGVQVRHAWSGYDERNDKWNGFMGSPFQNEIYKDNVGNTWNGEPRTFEYIGRSYAFGDPALYKELKDNNISCATGIDTKVTYWIDCYSTLKQCTKKKEAKKNSISSCDTLTPETTGSGILGASGYGAYTSYPNNLSQSIYSFKYFITAQQFQPHILGDGYGHFELEYLDFYMKPKSIHLYTT